MQKSEKKLNANAVGGDAHIDPLKQKGITLIALIITIIVMMILVGVTVATAINGGLFETAKKAAKDTQIEADKEALLAAMVGAMKADGTVNFEILEENLPEEWTENEDGTYTSPKGNTFTVSQDGKIEEVDGETGGGNPEIGEPETFNFPYGKYYQNGDEENGYTRFKEEGKYDSEVWIEITDIELIDGETIELKGNWEGEEEEITQTLKYVATENNVLICWEDEEINMIKSTEGMVYDLDGEYISSDGTKKLIFESESNEVYNYDDIYAGGQYPKEKYSYVQLAGKYYCAGEEMIFTDGYKTFTLNGTTYTNENASASKSETTLETIVPTNLDFIYGTYFTDAFDGENYFIIEENALIEEYLDDHKYVISYEEDTLYLSDKYGHKDEINYIKEGNDAIIWGEGLGLYATSKNAFKSMDLDLEGEYVNGTTKLVFEKGNHLVTRMDDMNFDGVFESEYSREYAYIKANGKYYYFDYGVCELQISGNTITIGTTTYTKVN